MNNTITEMKNAVEGIHSRITEAEERISEVEDIVVEITATEQNKEKGMKRNEDSLRDLRDNNKHTNILITGVPEGEEKEKEPEKIIEDILARNFPNMRKETLTLSPGSTENPTLDEPKEEHAKTHINQTGKN